MSKNSDNLPSPAGRRAGDEGAALPLGSMSKNSDNLPSPVGRRAGDEGAALPLGGMSKNPQSQLTLYQTPDGQTRIECRFEDKTVWLSQALMAELFQKDVRTINEHLVNLYEERELQRDATIRKFRIVRREGARDVAREIEFYNLDAIISVGYRVKSQRGTLFRQWATARLTEYLVKGFTMDDERLKNPPGKGHVDYFDELLERIRDFLNLNERAILPDSGNVSREVAHQHAEDEYERFATRRRADLEAQGEADLLNQLDAKVKKLPKPKIKGGKK